MLGDEVLECFRSPAQVRKATLLRLFHPIFRVVVSLEANGGRILEYFANDLEHGVINRLGLLESLAERICDLTDRIGDDGVEQSHRECDRRRGSNGAKLELLSGEREGRCAVAVGVVALNLR
jgi:hypothetical protein